MSETEHNVGKLTPLDITGDNETMARLYLESKEIEPKEYYDSFLEQLMDECSRTALIFEGKIYSIEVTENDPDMDIFKSSKNDDGIIDFEVRYYNGGCGFSEAIFYALDKIND
jgi:phosphoenolpyruvate synthase/pyruvate phosphate dikinase